MEDTPLALTDSTRALGLDDRVQAALDGLGIEQIADLVVMTEKRLIMTRKLGTPQVREIEAALGRAKLRLGMRPTEVARETPAEPAPPPSDAIDAEVARARHDVLVERDIEAIELPTRTAGALRDAGVDTVRALLALDDDALLALDGIGPKSLQDIKARLAEHGLDREGEAG